MAYGHRLSSSQCDAAAPGFPFPVAFLRQRFPAPGAYGLRSLIEFPSYLRLTRAKRVEYRGNFVPGLLFLKLPVIGCKRRDASLKARLQARCVCLAHANDNARRKWDRLTLW
jgi:hypothetical protein